MSQDQTESRNCTLCEALHILRCRLSEHLSPAEKKDLEEAINFIAGTDGLPSENTPTTVWGPERQDYPGGPVYRIGTSTGATLPPQPEAPRSAGVATKAWSEMSTLEREAYNAGVESMRSAKTPTSELTELARHVLESEGDPDPVKVLRMAARVWDLVQPTDSRSDK